MQTDSHLIAAFPFLRDVQTIIKFARLLNDSATVSDYTQLYANLSSTFHKLWYRNASVGYGDGQQTANTLALALPDVVPSSLRDSVVKALVSDINRHGHLTTGIVGVAQLFPVLSATGHHDLALSLAQSTTYPSYGWMFNNPYENATTLWELWDSPLDSRNGPDMDSRNHIMFGSIGAWFYRDVAGIQLDGLEHTHIRPRMAFDHTLMPELHAEVVTVKGPIAVDYSRQVGLDGHSIALSVRVPANSRATVHFEPLKRNGRCAMLAEGGRPLLERGAPGRGLAGDAVYSEGAIVSDLVDGVSQVSEDADSGVVSVRVGAGTYQFTARWE